MDVCHNDADTHATSFRHKLAVPHHRLFDPPIAIMALGWGSEARVVNRQVYRAEGAPGSRPPFGR